MQTTRSIQLSTGTSLQYSIGGSDAGTPLVLLHGFGLSMRQFYPNIVELEQQRQTISVTLRGHAGSAVGIPTDGSQWSIRALAEDVAALLPLLGLRRAHLLGHSLGALVALELVWQRRSTAASLILCETPVVHYESRLRTRLRALANRLLGPGHRVSRRLNGTDSPNRFVSSFARQLGSEAPREQVARLAGCLSGYDYADVVEKQQTPVLVLRGEQAPGEGTVDELGISEGLPHVEAVEIPGARHLLNLEQPMHFNHVVSWFLKRIDA